jgi:AP-1 complex subunit mu
MSAISALFILDARGRVLVYRDYRGDVPARHAERFAARLAESDDAGRLPPVLHDEGGVSCVHLAHGNVRLLAASRGNMNAAAAVAFLRHLVAVFGHYFGEVEEESVRDNFVTVYELLDEVMDHGWPQFTEARILSEYIKTDAHRLLEPLGLPPEAARPPMAVTNAVSWRSEGVRHKKNEVFLDVVEGVSMVVGAGGQVVVSEVQGVLKMRTYLSGMPECKLGLNDKVLFEAQGRSSAQRHRAVDLEDAKFHQCVRLARFDNDRTIR